MHRQAAAIAETQGQRLGAGAVGPGAQMLCIQIDRHDVGLGRGAVGKVAHVQHAVADRDPLEGDLPGFRWLSRGGLCRTAGSIRDQACQVQFTVGRDPDVHPRADQAYL